MTKRDAERHHHRHKYSHSPVYGRISTEQARCCVIVIEICSASSFISFLITENSAPTSPLFALDWDGGGPLFAPRFGGKRHRQAVSVATSSLDRLACAPLLARSSVAPFAVVLLDPRILKLCPLLSALILGDVDKNRRCNVATRTEMCWFANVLGMAAPAVCDGRSLFTRMEQKAPSPIRRDLFGQVGSGWG